ncbi:unnamed protein product [Brassica rapa subsp. narinosa]
MDQRRLFSSPLRLLGLKPSRLSSHRFTFTHSIFDSRCCRVSRRRSSSTTSLKL